MPRASQHLKETTFNFRLDTELKTAFTAATEAEDRPAAQVLRDFMRVYVRQREQAAREAELRRQTRAIAERAMDPASDEYAVMQELVAEFERDDFADEWKA